MKTVWIKQRVGLGLILMLVSGEEFSKRNTPMGWLSLFLGVALIAQAAWMGRKRTP